MGRKIRIVTALLLLVTGIVAPLLYRASVELSDAAVQVREHRAAGNIELTAQWCRRGLSWSTPVLQVSEEIIEMCGSAFDSAPEADRILLADAISEGLFSSRSAFVTEAHTALFERVDAALIKERGDAVLKDPKAPNTVNYRGQFISQGFFWLWILLSGWALWGGVTPDGRLRWATVLRRGIFAAAAYGGWLVALVAAPNL